MAAQYWRNNGQPERIKFVCFRHAYHGDTMGAMSVCDPEEGMHSHFTGFFPEQILTVLPRTQDEINNFSKFLQREKRSLAAVILEPLVQAAGGMKFHEPGVLRSIKAACKANDVLFIADEIAAGFGRNWHNVRLRTGRDRTGHHLPRQGYDRRFYQHGGNSGK